MNEESVPEATFEDFVAIAVYDGKDKDTEKIIAETLQAEGIEYLLEGSVVYSVQVPPEDKDKAIEVLKKSKALQGKWLKFVE